MGLVPLQRDKRGELVLTLSATRGPRREPFLLEEVLTGAPNPVLAPSLQVHEEYVSICEMSCQSSLAD